MNTRALLIAGSALIAVAVMSQPAVAGGGKGIELSDLAGVTAEAAQGSLTLCFEGAAEVACGTAGAVTVPYTYLSVGPVIRDANGNGCGAFTATYSDVPPDANPPLIVLFQVEAKFTSYNPNTATGDGTFTSYNGAKCVGPSISGGTSIGTGSFHSTASEGGNRIDSILTSLSGVGTFSISTTDHRE
jgi:hypothetical protein